MVGIGLDVTNLLAKDLRKSAPMAGTAVAPAVLAGALFREPKACRVEAPAVRLNGC